MLTRCLCVVAALLLAGGACSASTVTLGLQVDFGLETWQVYADVTNDCDGLASFWLDVSGGGGAAITGSTLVAARVWDSALNPPDGDFEGWSLFRNHGTNGIGIRASQNTIANDIDYLWLNEGVGTPLLLAQGTYSGTTGQLTADLHPTGSFNVFPEGFVEGQATQPAGVTSDTVIIPEPATVGLLGLGLITRLLRRRS